MTFKWFSLALNQSVRSNAHISQSQCSTVEAMHLRVDVECQSAILFSSIYVRQHKGAFFSYTTIKIKQRLEEKLQCAINIPSTMAMDETYIGLTCAFTIMFFTDIIGNCLVITVVLRYRSMHTPINYLLVNLAIADMMVAIFIAIQFIIGPLYTHPEGKAGIVLCKLITGGAVAWTSAVTSVFNLVAISVERYFAILYPHSEKGRINSRKLKYIIVASWLTSLFWNLPLFINVTYRYDIKKCGEEWPNQVLPKIYSFGWNIVVGVIPMSVMSYMYTKVVHTLWFKTDTTTSLAVIRTRKKVTKMVIAVSVIYVICWTPSLVIYFLAYMLPEEGVHSVNHQITIVLATFNSSINPVIYSLQSTGFRKYLCEMLCFGNPCIVDNRVEDEALPNQENPGQGQVTQETPA